MEGIDDILRNLDPDSYELAPESSDLQALTRAWVAERSAPELLEWPSDGVIESVNGRIRRQIEIVENMTGNMDPKTNFTLIVIETELERFKFLVRSFLRARIAKIDRHTLYYLSNPSLRARLSPTELGYATRHQVMLHDHYLASFMSSFPPAMQNLNDVAGNVSMIEAPDVDSAVFVRLLRDRLVRGRGLDSDDTLDGRAGDVLVMRWSSAKLYVIAGDAELV